MGQGMTRSSRSAPQRVSAQIEAWCGGSTAVLLTLFTVALVARLGAIFLVPAPDLSPNAVEAYIGGAHKIVEGTGFRDPSYPLFTPPLCALLIAIGIELFGNDQWPIKIVQGLADAGVVAILYVVCCRIFGARTGLLAGVLAALYPFTIYAATYIGSETLFSFFLTAFVLCALRAIESDRVAWHTAAGLAVGLATLTRGSTQFFPLFWLPLLAFFHGISRRVVQRFAAFCAAFALAIAPWAIRNYLVTDQVIPVAMAGGLVALDGSDEAFFTIPGRDDRLHQYYLRLQNERGIEFPTGHTTAKQWEAYYSRAALERYKIRWEEEPRSFPGFFALKFARLWYGTESGTHQGAILAANALVYPVCLAGIALAWRRRVRGSLLLLLPIVYLVLLHTAMFSMFRYIVPVMPFLLAFGAYALTAAAEEVLLSRRAGERAPA